jgi:hypothetical protein
VPTTILTRQIRLEIVTFKRQHEMTSKKYFEQTATSIASLDRNELKRQIRNFNGRFKLDFTEDYLNNLSVDRLRHILLAALINAKPHN